jgi:amidase
MAKRRTPRDLEGTLERSLEQAQNVREEVEAEGGLSRRSLLKWSAMAGAGASVAGSLAGAASAAAQSSGGSAAGAFDESSVAPTDLNDLTLQEMALMMRRNHLSSTELTEYYLQRIHSLDQRGPKVNSILELNPDAIEIAQALDKERRTKGPRGPLHGIPILLKDNYDTADQMHTTAGSFALLGPAAPQDSTCAARLRAAGAVLLGKTNLSEWANFRSSVGSSGWSGRGGQTKNPYILDRNPSGSSAGSAAAVTANFTAAGLGTETDGSIVSPASNNGVVGIHPTLGLTSRAGVVPISHSQDVTGPHGRCVMDAAIVLGALVGVDSRDAATAASAGKFFTDYTHFLSKGALNGARIGVTRQVYTGYSAHTDAIYENAIAAMKDAGAIIIDPADIPTATTINSDPSEFNFLIYDFLRDMNAYLATRVGLGVKTLADLIAFNDTHAGSELELFDQAIFLLAQADPVTADVYTQSLAMSHSLSRDQGIDAVLQQFRLDCIIAPTGAPAWTTDLINGDHFIGSSSTPAAMAGYPNITVNAGYAFGAPVGVSFIGTAWTEPRLLALAYSFEQAINIRKQPTFLPTAPTDRGVVPQATAQAVLLERMRGGAGSSPYRLHNI